MKTTKTYICTETEVLRCQVSDKPCGVEPPCGCLTCRLFVAEARGQELEGEINGTDPYAADPSKWGLKALLEGVRQQREKAEARVRELEEAEPHFFAGIRARQNGDAFSVDASSWWQRGYTYQSRAARLIQAEQTEAELLATIEGQQLALEEMERQLWITRGQSQEQIANLAEIKSGLSETISMLEAEKQGILAERDSLQEQLSRVLKDGFKAIDQQEAEYRELRQWAEEARSMILVALHVAQQQQFLALQSGNEYGSDMKQVEIKTYEEVLRILFRPLPGENRIKVDGHDVTDFLHPTGHCTCAGEGTCEWCRSREEAK